MEAAEKNDSISLVTPESPLAILPMYFSSAHFSSGNYKDDLIASAFPSSLGPEIVSK